MTRRNKSRRGRVTVGAPYSPARLAEWERRITDWWATTEQPEGNAQVQAATAEADAVMSEVAAGYYTTSERVAR